jgi:hypothetical protein
MTSGRPKKQADNTGFRLKYVAVTSWIKQRTPEFFIDGMRKLVLRWEKCIERQGDYVEK